MFNRNQTILNLISFVYISKVKDFLKLVCQPHEDMSNEHKIQLGDNMASKCEIYHVSLKILFQENNDTFL